jgi:hypothetical protein
MSKKPSAQRRAEAKMHRSDAAFWKGHSKKQDDERNVKFFRQAAADHLKEARRLERGK